jgi:hypothetical protein
MHRSSGKRSPRGNGDGNTQRDVRISIGNRGPAGLKQTLLVIWSHNGRGDGGG